MIKNAAQTFGRTAINATAFKFFGLKPAQIRKRRHDSVIPDRGG